MGQYALRLSDDEVSRYQWMARRARETEAELWRLAGISAGADVVDVGCGPGAILVAMADVVGPGGSVTGVEGRRCSSVGSSRSVDVTDRPPLLGTVVRVAPLVGPGVSAGSG